MCLSKGIERKEEQRERLVKVVTRKSFQDDSSSSVFLCFVRQKKHMKLIEIDQIKKTPENVFLIMSTVISIYQYLEEKLFV